MSVYGDNGVDPVRFIVDAVKTAKRCAGEATSAASSAAGSESVAVAKAGEAASSAAEAAASALEASDSAGSAVSHAAKAAAKAEEAAASASTAGTKASEAVASASSAAGSATAAARSASNAEGSAGRAENSASSAAGSASDAAASASGAAADAATATAQAALATTHAGNAAASAATASERAEAADNSSTAAAASAATAGTKAEEAAASAITAGAKAVEATNSATAAGEYEVLAGRWATSTTVVTDDKYGALKYAGDAAASATDAGDAATAASASSTEASGRAADALDTYGKVADTYDKVVETYEWAAKASADAQGHAEDALLAKEAAEAAQGAVEGAQEACEGYAGQASQSATAAAGSAAQAAASALSILSGNNTYLGNNTFGGNNVHTGAEIFGGNVSLGGSLVFGGVTVDNIQGSKFFNCTKATEILEIDPLIKYRRHVTLHIKGPMVDGSNGEALGSQLFGEQPGWQDRIVDITIDSYRNNGWMLTGFRSGTLNLYIKDGYNGDYLTVSANVKNFIVQLDTCTNFGALTKQMRGVEHIAVLAPKATTVVLDWLNGYATNTLTSIVLITPEAVNCERMLTSEATQNSLVTYFYMPYTSKVENANYAFSNGSNGTSSAKSIPSSQFPGSWPSLKTGVHMFSYCALLDATKANAILDSLPDWSDEETPTTHEIGFTGTKAALTDWVAAGADLSHVAAARAKGWTVTGAPATE